MRTNSLLTPNSVPSSAAAVDASAEGRSISIAGITHSQAGCLSRKPIGRTGAAPTAIVRLTGLTMAALLLVSGFTQASQSIERRRMSLGGSTEEPNGSSSGTSDVSLNGDVVVFGSTAQNITALVFNNNSEIYWRRVQAGQTLRVTQPVTGGGNNGPSVSPRVSANGQWVVFTSSSSNLVVNDGNGWQDVFIWDSVSRSTVLVSRSPGGPSGNSGSFDADVSGDGRFVVFASDASNLVSGDTNGTADVFLLDRTTSSLSMISRTQSQLGNGYSSQPRISDDGNFIAFTTAAFNLIPGDTNAKYDVVVFDRVNQNHIPVSNNPLLAMGNNDSLARDISADGAFVVFDSNASNLVAGDTNNATDVFRWRRSNGNILRVSVSYSGLQGNWGGSGGRCDASGLRVTFDSNSNDLVAVDNNGQRDVFLRDVQQQTTIRVSNNYLGGDAQGDSNSPSISGDGRFVSLTSSASNLVPVDLNGWPDIFAIGDLCSGASTYCVAKPNSNTCIPFICSEGQPSLSSVSGITVTAGRVLNQKSGIFFWGRAPASVPLYGGTRCVQNPVVRSPSQDSGGNPSINDCSGSYRFQFDQAYMNLHGLVPGDQVFGQFWSRDPFFVQPNNVGLTDGIEFTVTP